MAITFSIETPQQNNSVIPVQIQTKQALTAAVNKRNVYSVAKNSPVSQNTSIIISNHTAYESKSTYFVFIDHAIVGPSPLYVHPWYLA